MKETKEKYFFAPVLLFGERGNEGKKRGSFAYFRN